MTVHSIMCKLVRTSTLSVFSTFHEFSRYSSGSDVSVWCFGPQMIFSQHFYQFICLLTNQFSILTPPTVYTLAKLLDNDADKGLFHTYRSLTELLQTLVSSIFDIESFFTMLFATMCCEQKYL